MGFTQANRALDMLEAEDGDGGPSYSAYGSDPDPSAPAKKKPSAPPDPAMPERWNPELVPIFPIYLHKTSPWLQQVAVRGLFEWRLESGEIESDTGSDMDIDSSRLRRARLGLAMKAYYDTEILADALFDGDGDYRGIETLKAGIPVGEATFLTLGKLPPPFTLEYTQDAAVRWTPELSPLVGQVVPASSLGVLLEGYTPNWDWKLMDDALRLVGRYNYANSDDDGGTLSGWGVPRSGGDALQPFDYPVTAAGAELHSIYAGLNLSLYEDNLILSAGLEFRSLDDVVGGDKLESWIWQAGGRLGF